jgi:antitoxin component YwqK of YwqJK toxin-antitoxin module
LLILGCQAPEQTESIAREHGKYINNSKEGKWTGYYENDVLEDVMHGEFIHYYSNGKINFRKQYDNGKENGLFELYYETGDIKQKGYIKNGKNTGEWFYYDPDGVVKEKEIYTDSIKKVMTLTFNKKGDAISSEVKIIP